MNQRHLVLYHGACPDGFCAAWCVRKIFPDAEFIGVEHGGAVPDVTGRDVLMVDFCYPPDVMRDLASKAVGINVLDHHKSSMEAMDAAGDIPRIHTFFDMQHSGAGLAWQLYTQSKMCVRPNQQVPWLVRYVEDRDLWRKALPESEAICAYIGTLPYDFEAWDRASHLSAGAAAKLGEGAAAQIAQYVREVGKNAVEVFFEGWVVPAVNAPQVNISDLVGSLVTPEVAFAMGWWRRGDGKFCYSLRSVGDFDVSELAKKWGGGGHKNAAGFQADRLIF